MNASSSTDEQLRPVILEALAQIIDELPTSPTEDVSAADRQEVSRARQSGGVVLLATAAAVVALVAGLVLVAQLRIGEEVATTPPSAPESAGVDGVADDTTTAMTDGVRMVVWVNANAMDESMQLIRDELGKLSDLIAPDGIRYLGPEESLHEARTLLADDPATLESLTLHDVPTAFYLTPNEAATYDDLAAAASLLRNLPEVARVDVDPTGRPVIPGIAEPEPPPAPVTLPTTTSSVSDSTGQPMTNPTLPVERVDYYAIGDSVMLGAAAELAVRGYTVNATVSRQMSDVIPLVADLVQADLLDQVVIVHLGNNGPFTAETLDDFLAPLAELDNVVILNVYAERPWAAENNRLLAERDQSGDNLIVIDWNSIAQDCPDCFAADNLHLNEQGRVFYADAIGEYTGK